MFVIHCVVLWQIFSRVSRLGVDGFIKSVSFVTCLDIPGGNVLDSAALSIMCLWWMAWISLKYCLLVCLVIGSGGSVNVV